MTIKKKEELSLLFDKFSKDISKKKDKIEQKVKLKNYNKFKDIICVKNKVDETEYFKTLSPIQQEKIIKQLESLKDKENIKPYRIQLLELNIPIETKSVVLKKMDTLMNMNKCS